MNTTLNMYDNLQYDAIPIQDYTIVEVYKDSIAEDNSLGYTILPIEGLNIDTIETKIAEIAATNLPSGYENYVVLPGRNETHDYDSYNHRVCYLIYYTSDTAPTYPDAPDIGEAIEPATAFNKWNIANIAYYGAIPSPLTLYFTVVKGCKTLEFYLRNEDYFSIPLKDFDTDTSLVVVSNEGIYQDGVELIDYEMTNYPIIEPTGTAAPSYNSLKVDKKWVSNVTWYFYNRY